METFDPAYLGFLLSALLLCSTSLLLAAALGSLRDEKFWILTASLSIQLGTIAQVVSLFGQLNRVGWSILQFLLSGAILIGWRQTGRAFKVRFDLQPLQQSVAQRRNFLRSLGSGARLSLLCLVVVVLLSGIEQGITPIGGFDERMYHGSRVLYWLQNQSIFPFVTHNDRQTVFPFGSELLFLWPLLFTGSEAVGRLLFWSAYPLASYAFYVLLRELKLDPAAAMPATLLFAATPIVYRYSIGLAPELWLILFVLGTAVWVIRAYQAPEVIRNSFYAALFLTLSINVKTTALFLLPSVLVLPWLTGNRKYALRRVAAVSGAVLLGFAATGLAVPILVNLAQYGHPLGPLEMIQVHRSDLSPEQIYTHTVRFLFLLLEFPVVPFGVVRESVERVGNAAILALGAAQHLSLESSGSWPGVFRWMVRGTSINYSLGGLVWLASILLGAVCLVRDLRCGARFRLSLVSVIAVLALPFTFGVVFLIRWMTESEVPERFLLAPYALGFAGGVVLLHSYLAARPVAGKLAIGLLALAVIATLRIEVLQLHHALVSTPQLAEHANEPFNDAIRRIPPGSQILLIGSQDVRDYPLFGPRNGFPNRVIPWGKGPFDGDRLENVVRKHAIDFVLIENDEGVDVDWNRPGRPTRGVVILLSNHPEFREVPLRAERQRLFERRRI